MKLYQKILLSTVILLMAFGIGLYFLWKQGTPYFTPTWSPNNQYYVQKYRNVTFSDFFPAMPGQGSDKANGYIRLYDKDGNMLGERFVYFFRDVEPFWVDNKVYLSGVAEMDNDLWILPTSAE